jgi:hypothetical protein
MEKMVLTLLFGAKPVIKQLVLVLGLLCISSPPAFSHVESAFQLVKEKTINRNLALQFPVDKSFQGSKARFSDAKILIDILDQSVKLQMTVSANSAEQSLTAKMVFTGKMQYDQFLESYLFEGLLLDSFKIEHDSYVSSLPIVKIIKQSLINDFEDIVLFNLTDINTLAPKRSADEIEISMGQLRFIWN